MQSIRFYVQGRSIKPHIVEFTLEGRNLNAHCDCMAGLKGQYCSHRLNILNGIKEGIVSKNAHEVDTVVEWMHDSDIEDALNRFKLIHSEIEFEMQRLHAKLAAAKDEIAKAMQR